MKYENLYENFIDNVSEARRICASIAIEKGVDKSDGMHIMFGLVVTPYVLSILKEGDVNTLKEIATFIESVEISKDITDSEVIEQSLLEYIIADDKDLVNSYNNLWGEETCKAIKSIEKFVA